MDRKVTYTHHFDPTFVLIRQTGWTRAQIWKRAVRTTRIYSECGIAMPGYKLVIVDPPFGYVDLGWTDGRDQKIADATPSTSRPMVYFGRYDRDGYYAFTWRKSLTKIASLKNTTWMTRSLDEDKEFKHSVSPSYEVLAHELGHMIGDMGHIDDGSKSLMAQDGNLLNGDITAFCALYKQSDLLSTYP